MIIALERLMLNKEKNDIDVWMDVDEIMREFPEKKENILALLKAHRPAIYQQYFAMPNAISI